MLSIIKVLILSAVLIRVTASAEAAMGAAVSSVTPEKVSRRDSYVPSSDELFKNFAPAVVKILVRLHGVPVNVGTGFFIAADGALLTNRHVLKDVLHGNGFTAEFILRDKHVVKDFQFGHCSDEKQIDLCLVKLAVKSKAFFKLSVARPGENDPAYTIGHPRGMDFSITYGLVKGYRTTALGTEEMRVSTAMGPGSSGGPLFDHEGKIIGVASKYSANRLNDNAGIPLGEVSRFVDESMNFLPLAEARARFTEYMRESMRAKRETELEPAMNAAKKGESFAGRKDFIEKTFEFGSQKLSLVLPNIFDTCRQEKRAGANEILHACFGYGDSVVFTLQRFSAKGFDLRSRQPRKLLASKPLALVSQLQHDGAWDSIDKILTVAQKKDFRSDPALAKCTKIVAAKNSSFNAAESCEFVVYNDAEPNAQSQNLWIEQGANIFAISVWLNDSNLEEYFSKLPMFAALTAHGVTGATLNTGSAISSANGLQDKRLTSYALTFPDTYEFMGARVDASADHYDLFAPRTSRGFAEAPLYSVTEKSETVLPPSYDTQALKWIEASAKISGTTIASGSLVLGSFDVEQRPARIASGVGRDRRGRDSVVLACVLYGKDMSHVITKVLPATDPSTGFRAFKELCSSFRREPVGTLQAGP